MLSGSYPRRLPLRRDFAVGCSISQNNQTKAVPRPTTTPRNNNVKAGAVSMFNIPDAMQAAYQRNKTAAPVMITPGPHDSSRIRHKGTGRKLKARNPLQSRDFSHTPEPVASA